MMTEPKNDMTETLIEGYRKGAIGNGRPNKPKAAVVEASPPEDIVGESPARRRKAAQQRPGPCPHAPDTRPVCQRVFRSRKCCECVVDHRCQPPVSVRLLFNRGFNGVINVFHIRIAAGTCRDAKSAD